MLINTNQVFFTWVEADFEIYFEEAKKKYEFGSSDSENFLWMSEQWRTQHDCEHTRDFAAKNSTVKNLWFVLVWTTALILNARVTRYKLDLYFLWKQFQVFRYF